MKLFLLLMLGLTAFVHNFSSPSYRVQESRISVFIDASNKDGLASFNENVMYNLKFDKNQLESASLIRNLPVTNAEYFDLKVKSDDVKILKYEISDKNKVITGINNFDYDGVVKLKVLKIEFEQNKNEEKSNFNQGLVNIDYSYKVKNY